MDRLNYHHLYYFWVVAKEESFTRAAHRLSVAQSAVSLQVAQLETFFGHKLILRSTSKKLSLTEHGQQVFIQAEDIFNQGNELVASMTQGLFQSSIRIGALGSLSKNLQVKLLKPILGGPEFQLSVDVADSATLLARLLGFHLDAILCDIPYPSSEEEPLIQREVAREKMCLAGNPAGRKKSFKARIEESGIYLPAKSNPVTSEILSYFSKSEIKARVRGYIDDIALLRLLALETESIIAIPRVGVERDLRSKALVVYHQFSSQYQRFYLVMRQRGHRSDKLMSLLKQN